MRKFLTRLAVAAAVALPSVCAFAEGESSGDSGAQIISGAQSALTTLLTTAGGAVVALVLAGLAIWGGLAIVGILKRAFGAGKGR